MRKTLLALLLVLIPFSGFSLSGKSRISILTSDPGIEYNTIFGHSAIRITDDSLAMDAVYNFGSFNFSESNFYIKFIKGDLRYFLSVVNYGDFFQYAESSGQRVYEQTLDLSLKERTEVFNRLISCYNSPDRYYTYDFFFNNCATKVRDVIFNSTENALYYNTDKYCGKTFRQLLKPFIEDNYWTNFGVNFLLGNQSDITPSASDYMFLPFYVKEILEKTSVVKEQKVILEGKIAKHKNSWSYILPWLIAATIVALSLNGRTRKITFYIIVSTLGLAGLLLLTIGLVSSNLAFSNNLNLYWTLPSALLLCVRQRKIKKTLEIAYLLLMILILVLWVFLHDAFSYTFLPWMISLATVLFMDFYKGKNI